MRYLLDRNFSFFSFFVVISFLFIALLYLPITATAADIFSESSASKWDTIVDSDGSPAGNTGSNRGTSVDDNRLPTNRKTNHYSPSRLDEKRVQLKAESGNNIKAEKKRAVRKSVTYSGRAEADGRSATLELHFDGNNVSGRLQAKGVSEKYIRLPSTDATFAPIPLNGTWEADDTTIFASWKGGDFIDGVLIPDYPTRGNLSIKLAERDGKKVVYLHRIDSSSTGYVFPLKGVVYTPPDADNSDDPAAGNGYWDPVGSWSGVEFDCPFKTVLEKSGAVTVTITCENDEPEYRKGKWNRQGNGIKVKWSRATMKEHELEKSTFHAFFDGANCLILDGGDDDGARLFRDSKVSCGNNFPKQTIYSSNSLAPRKNTPGGYTMPSFSKSIYCGVVTMSWMESRSFAGNPRDGDLNYLGDSPGKVLSIKSYRNENVFVTSGLKYVQTGKSIRVKAKNEGQQQVWISYIINYTGKDFATGEMVYDQDGLIIFSWLVLVGEDEINKYEGKKPNSAKPDKKEKPDIAKFTISGIVKEMGSFQCVEGAIVELIPKSSNQICRTDKDGRFKYTFTSLHSGRKELFVRKPYGQDGVSSHPLDSVEQDLWPIKKYMFVLDTKKAGADMIITEIIWVQKNRYIDNRYEKNLSFEFQKK